MTSINQIDKQYQLVKIEQCSPDSYQLNVLKISNPCSQKIIQYQTTKEKTKQLTCEQKQKFMTLYIENRPKWGKIVQGLPGRSQRQLKNFYYNALRNLSSKMSNLQKKQRTFQKNTIKNQVLLKLIDLSIFLEKSSQFLEIQTKYENLPLHCIRRQILQFCFEDKQIKQQKLSQMIKTIRNLNFRYKNIKFSWNTLTNKNEAIQIAVSLINQSSVDYIDFRKRKSCPQTSPSEQKESDFSEKRSLRKSLSNQTQYMKEQALQLAPLILEYPDYTYNFNNQLVGQYNMLLGINQVDHGFQFI